MGSCRTHVGVVEKVAAFELAQCLFGRVEAVSRQASTVGFRLLYLVLAVFESRFKVEVVVLVAGGCFCVAVDSRARRGRSRRIR